MGAAGGWLEAFFIIQPGQLEGSDEEGSESDNQAASYVAEEDGMSGYGGPYQTYRSSQCDEDSGEAKHKAEAVEQHW